MNIYQEQTSDNLITKLSNILNTDVTIRTSAENQIKLLASENLSQFLISISEILSDEKERKEIRQLSATLIKNMISNVNYIQKYFEISPEIKQKIKNNILSTLASSIVEIRKAAALAVAGICKIELPNHQWNNIFDILCNTSQNENLFIQLSSLTTLEYIYEEISINDINLDTKAKLLNTYYFLLNKNDSNDELILAALKSLNKFLPFIRDFIYNKESCLNFFELIKKNVMNPNNEKIRQEGIKIFIDISRIYYDSLNIFIEKIYEFSEKIVKNDVDVNKIWILNLWFFIGNEEDYRMNFLKNNSKKVCHYFLQRYYEELSDICLTYVITISYNEEDNDENNLSFSSGQLIYIMSRVCDFNFMQKMIKFIELNINSNLEQNKYSALYVFKAIIGTIHKKNFYFVVKDSLSMISDILLEDKYPIHFKKLSGKIMKNITFEYAEELTNDKLYFDKMIQLFLTLININIIISEKEILYDIIQSLCNLSKKISWNESDKTNILSKHIKNISEPLIKLVTNLSYYNTQNNVTSMSFYLLGLLGERSALDAKDYLVQIFKYLISLYESSLNPNNIQDEDIRLRYQEYLSNCLTGFIVTGKVDKSLIGNLLSLIIKSFNSRDLYDEGLTLIGAIALFTQDDFAEAMELISPYLKKGLQSKDSPSICYSSILCLSDIIRGLESKNKYVNDYFPLIMNILSDNSIDRNLKPLCFNIISDLFLYCPNDAFNYFKDIMKILGEAIQATQVKFDENEEKENLDHFINLREHILESLNCVFHAVREFKKIKEFIPYVVCIVNYINFISNDFANSINILKDGLFLLADFCDSYKKDIKNILNIENIKNLIQKIENDKTLNKDENFFDSLRWAKNAIGEIFE